MALLGCGEFRITIDGKIDSCIDGENDEVDEITAVPDIQEKPREMLRAAILVILVSVANGMSISIYSNNCAVVNGVLYIDGVSKGPLTPEQQQQLKQYQQEVKEWNKALQQSIQSSFPWNPSNPESKNFPWNPNGIGAPRAPYFGNNWPYGSQNNPFGPGFPFNNALVRARRSAVPPFPSPPPFCNQ